MVFNWFRRQFDEEQETETPPAEAEQTSPPVSSDAAIAPEDVAEEAESEAEDAQATAETTAQTPDVAMDYLQWARAAYQNIQAQQATESESTAVAEADSVVESADEETAAVAEGEETAVANADVSEVQSEAGTITESAAPEPEPPEAATAASETVEASDIPESSAIEVAESEGSAATTEPEVPADVEADVAEETAIAPDVESETAEPESVATETTTEPEPTDIASATEAESSEAEPTSEAAESVPFWAKADGERAARMERLKATAIETPEEPTPEPVSASTAPTSDAATAAPVPDAIAFDESFLWSAEVLAAQGRRPEDVSIEEITWLQKLRQGLDKTRRNILNQLKAVVGQGPLNQDAVMEIEALLLQSDVGVEATDFIIESLQEKLREEALPPEEAIAYLKRILREMLDRPYNGENASYTPTFAPEKDTLNIWLITGVNGAGKTTTIGKIAHLAQKSDYNCLIAAADTFRAAAVQQVKVWGERSGVDVIANPGQNTDPAAVVFDAIASAQSRDTELLLVDTAGRLQNKKNLMDELGKIRRIIDKRAPDATIQSLLVLDATLGQNGLRQAQVFAEVAQLSGVVLTKLDGTAKGGVALAVVQQLGLPIRFIGAGEGIEDLRPFSSYEFVEALLNG